MPAGLQLRQPRSLQRQHVSFPGQVMFLHTNFVPKMNLQLPFSMEAYTRHAMVMLHACI